MPEEPVLVAHGSQPQHWGWDGAEIGRISEFWVSQLRGKTLSEKVTSGVKVQVDPGLMVHSWTSTMEAEAGRLMEFEVSLDCM